MEIIMEIIMWW